MRRNRDDVYYQALLTRDYRFDGKFFTGVKTTGIYCRPICPARPKRENVEFFSTALEAEKSGYRPCLRCRPESAPQSPAWIGKSSVVQRALKILADQDSMELNEDEFAEKLGLSARHLRRLFEEELGKTPKQISDSRRLDFARKLVLETRIPVTEIAFASGFGSIRRFNDAFRDRFKRSPRELRDSKKPPESDESGVELSLSYRPPLDWEQLIGFFKRHPIHGVESAESGAYERVFRLDGDTGYLRLEPIADRNELKLKVVTSNFKNILKIAKRVRRMFDLDSDPVLIANGFSDEPLMRKLYEKQPGLRIASGWDVFETSIGTILGQLVSLDRAAALVRQLIENYGEEAKHPVTGAALRLFPAPEVLAREALSKVGTTQARKNALREFSRQVLEKKLSLDPAQDPVVFKERLLEIKGIGPWSAEYIALRALGDTDAFPSSDLILKRAIDLHPEANLGALNPWRGYAAIYLWHEFAPLLSKKTPNKKIPKFD